MDKQHDGAVQAEWKRRVLRDGVMHYSQGGGVNMLFGVYWWTWPLYEWIVNVNRQVVGRGWRLGSRAARRACETAAQAATAGAGAGEAKGVGEDDD